jgi:hypothetical protein
VLHNKFVGTKKRYAFYLSLNKKDFSLHLWRNLHYTHYVAPKHIGIQ